MIAFASILIGAKMRLSASSDHTTMKYLFENWESLKVKIRGAQDLFLLLDFDGTLTPIVSKPELALCPFKVRKLLEKLRDLPGIYPTIISGRSLDDVREKVGVSGITYVGNHGLEIQNPVGRHRKSLVPARKRELNRITGNLKNSLKDIPGILFEEKGPILSVHYRNVPAKLSAGVIQAVKKELQKRKDRWKTASGKMVSEIRPNIDFHKGKAVRELLKASSPKALPIYLGDDQTDEDAFRVLRRRGISVYVGRPGASSSEADFFLRNPDEVQEFLCRCYAARQDVVRKNGS